MDRVRQELSALFGATGRPAISTCVFWCCAALAYPLAARGGYAGAVGAAIVFSLSVLLLAYVLGSGALAFVVDAKRSCLPGSRRLARRAHLLAVLLLLPAIVLTVAALAGNPIWPVWVPTVLVLGVAIAGLLAPRRPTSAAGLLLLIVLAACWEMSGRSDHERGKEWHSALLGAALVLLAAALPLLAAVKWRRVIRWGSGPRRLAERLRSIRVRVDRRGTLEHAIRTAPSRNGSAARQPPAQIVRTCLGGMFGQLSRQLIVGAALVSLFVVAAIGISWVGVSAGRWIIMTLALAVGGLVSGAFLTRLPKLTRGQIAELALMPGLGAPAAQRRALYRAVLAPPLLWLGVVFLLGSADLLLQENPLLSIGMLAVCLVTLWLSYTIFALQKLATLPPKPQSFISEFLLLYFAVYASGIYSWLYARHPHFVPGFWFWATPVLLSVGIASAIGSSLRRLATAPHPFLASASPKPPARRPLA